MSKEVTLVIVDTESYVLANNAIEQSLGQFNFSEVLIFTDRPDYWPSYRTYLVDKIKSIEDYNVIMLTLVPFQVSTPFFMVIQYDGFILNGGRFDPSFFEYDYIGAPWPAYAYSHFRVGNGGFSFRSKRLALAAAGMVKFRDPMDSEDAFISRVVRVALELRHGCKFASEEVASIFSYEMLMPSVQSFGFHGLMHLPIVYQDNLAYLLEHLPERVILNKKDILAQRLSELSDMQQGQFWQTLQERVQKLEG